MVNLDIRVVQVVILALLQSTHFERELRRLDGLVLARIDDRHEVLLVADREMAAIGRVHDVDVLSARSNDTYGLLRRSRVPDSNRAIGAGAGEAVGVRRIEAQLIDRVRVARQDRVDMLVVERASERASSRGWLSVTARVVAGV